MGRLDFNEMLELIPHRAPFRFVDEITHVDGESIEGRYRFKETEHFYVGHFPGFPITPGVILLEAMCQLGILCHAAYLVSEKLSKEELAERVGFFTDSERFEVRKPVFPGQTVLIRGEKLYFRMGKIKSKLTMTLEDGTLVAEAIGSGIAMSRKTARRVMQVPDTKQTE